MVSVPRASASNPGTTTYDLKLSLRDTASNQDACKGLSLNMHYSAAATYNEVYGTTTHVVSSQNPTIVGQNITYTATVTAIAGTRKDPVPSSPTGSVTFEDNGTNISSCVNVGLSSTGTTTATATCTVSYGAVAVSPHLITAAYTNTDGNFRGRPSNALRQVVNPANPTCITGTYSGNYTVPAGQSICITGTVTGHVQVQAGGSLTMSGAHIGGGVTSTLGADTLRFCGSTISGNVTIKRSTGFVLIGDGGDVAPGGDDSTPACAGNTIDGSSITIGGNHGNFELGGNTITGQVAIQYNASGGASQEVEANTVTGSLSCLRNHPAPIDDGLPNHHTGSATGQCAGAGF